MQGLVRRDIGEAEVGQGKYLGCIFIDGYALIAGSWLMALDGRREALRVERTRQRIRINTDQISNAGVSVGTASCAILVDQNAGSAGIFSQRDKPLAWLKGIASGVANKRREHLGEVDLVAFKNREIRNSVLTAARKNEKIRAGTSHQVIGSTPSFECVVA